MLTREARLCRGRGLKGISVPPAELAGGLGLLAMPVASVTQEAGAGGAIESRSSRQLKEYSESLR